MENKDGGDVVKVVEELKVEEKVVDMELVEIPVVVVAEVPLDNPLLDT